MKTAIQFLGTALSVLLLVPTFLTGCGRNSSHSGDDFKSVGVAVVQMSDHTTANEDATVQTANPVKAAANASPSWQALSMETETLGTLRY